MPCVVLKTNYFELKLTVAELMFASGSLDGTIVVWNVETFAPVQSFNCVDDYQGDDRMYRYSIQHMTAVEGGRSN